ncbi:RNA polymerase sigma-70 factor, ECF subfamily protein [Plesiocystis pacifica SIR-1]|uniref:RNA polymerase sigma-70 factor, ECF subfamily protein n=1 Tax=Plesiocystis pacifica SIR-1 TaxID=391625 RepID=A6GE73_9BACT|nr:RNA polymerase sigma factor [Plesiocystis pacifica]EDM75791.1 RNA polymerase sigma-70 factor, ECF subfamily protein [Plesiocystis pacifica SIR-1]
MSQNNQDRYQGLAVLMGRYLDGDQRAFNALYRKVSPMVRAQVRARISDPATADELVQSVFMKAHGARTRYAAPEGANPDRAVIVWYSAIARNATIDHVRRIYRERAVKVDTAGDDTARLLEGLADVAPNSEGMVVEHERQLSIAARIRGALASLPKGQREVVTKHKLEGRTMAEIAEELGVREGTLRVRAHRGYKALATALGSFSQAAAAA